MNDTIMTWKNVEEGLPKQPLIPHKNKLYLKTKTFGTFVGFFNNGKFWTSYAEELHDVIEWCVLPN